MDGDGFTSWQEYLAGTDPTDPDSHFKIIDTRDENGMIHLTWMGGSTSPHLPSFGILRSTDLSQPGGGFELVGHLERSTSATNVWSIPTPTIPSYFTIIAPNAP